MTASLSSRTAAMLVINACAVLLAFAAVLFDGRAANAQTQDTFDRIVREKKVRFGYIISPPGAIRDPASGQITGFYVDGARGIAELMKVESVLVETSWSTFATALQAGQFDISIAATFATIPRAMAVAFTNSLPEFQWRRPQRRRALQGHGRPRSARRQDRRGSGQRGS
jgi:ABC-type amino acid transport substrate-binding protein